jgi:hypothetical protein
VASTALVLIYFWVFSAATCTSRGDLACMLNSNQGVLTAAAAIVAAAALWAAIWLHEQDRRWEITRMAEEARAILVAAIDEILHNLHHIAGACDDGGHLQSLPQIEVEATRLLARPSLGQPLEMVRPEAANILRLHQTYEDLRAMPLPNPHQAARRAWAAAVGPIVMQSIRILAQAFMYYRKNLARFDKLAYLRDFAELPRLSLSAPGDFEYATWEFTSDIPPGDLAEARLEGYPMFCWADDAKPESVAVRSLFHRLRDDALAGPHS